MLSIGTTCFKMGYISMIWRFEIKIGYLSNIHTTQVKQKVKAKGKNHVIKLDEFLCPAGAVYCLQLYPILSDLYLCQRLPILCPFSSPGHLQKNVAVQFSNYVSCFRLDSFHE